LTSTPPSTFLLPLFYSLSLSLSFKHATKDSPAEREHQREGDRAATHDGGALEDTEGNGEEGEARELSLFFFEYLLRENSEKRWKKEKIYVFFPPEAPSPFDSSSSSSSERAHERKACALSFFKPSRCGNSRENENENERARVGLLAREREKKKREKEQGKEKRERERGERKKRETRKKELSTRQLSNSFSPILSFFFPPSPG
jgi:hypothetical protein